MKQERLLDLRGNRMTLSTPPMRVSGGHQVARLIGERVGTA